jgi:hypothetical protein
VHDTDLNHPVVPPPGKQARRLDVDHRVTS